MRPSWRLLGLGLAATGWGCTPHATQAQLRATAAREFNCPADNLRYRTLDERSRWVAGCGKSATFREQCGREGAEGCSWERQPDPGDP
ncbi:MAG: hypothetical protein MUF64_30000 [Polyangiaceae bacterium]|jgi:hypothetical protein|nr:hypothetical protein [Polyangiaceae bacterium]